MTRRPDWADPDWQPTDEQLAEMARGKPKSRLNSPHNILTAYSRGEIGATDAMSMLHIETMADLHNAMADVGHPFPPALGYGTDRLHVLDGMKAADRPEHLKRWADEVLEEPKREPMIFRKLRENAEAIRNMGREEIAKAHAMGVSASYASRELGEGIVRETPDGIRHLERKVDGEWVEVATFPPREDWVDPSRQ